MQNWYPTKIKNFQIKKVLSYPLLKRSKAVAAHEENWNWFDDSITWTEVCRRKMKKKMKKKDRNELILVIKKFHVAKKFRWGCPWCPFSSIDKTGSFPQEKSSLCSPSVCLRREFEGVVSGKRWKNRNKPRKTKEKNRKKNKEATIIPCEQKGNDITFTKYKNINLDAVHSSLQNIKNYYFYFFTLTKTRINFCIEWTLLDVSFVGQSEYFPFWYNFHTCVYPTFTCTYQKGVQKTKRKGDKRNRSEE